MYIQEFVLPINAQYNPKETTNPENQDNLYKASKAGTKYPISATATPVKSAIIAQGLNPE